MLYVHLIYAILLIIAELVAAGVLFLIALEALENIFEFRVFFLVQGGAWWIGVHYSTDTRRICINLVPCLTICIVLKGGAVPRQLRAKGIT